MISSYFSSSWFDEFDYQSILTVNMELFLKNTAKISAKTQVWEPGSNTLIFQYS